MFNIDNNIIKKEEITKELKSNEYLDKAFDLIPSNAIINKGRCGIGGTTLEINSSRHSIIIVPNIPTIECKLLSHPFIIGVYGTISKKDLKSKIKDCIDTGNYVKILCTPDSFEKLIESCLEIEFNLFNECFLLIDEYHTMITEQSYREKIIKPLNYLFDFKDKSLISATPFKLSDPNFNSFTRFKIISKSINNNIKLVITRDIFSDLINILEQLKSNNNLNTHVFYNSVSSIAQIVNLLADNNDINIYCADNNKNIEKLGNNSCLLAKINDQQYKKINFYTTKYNEGWDLYDENAVIILVSDINKPHTCFDIEIKGTQAIGRLRTKAKAIYHITNHRHTNTVFENQIIQDTKELADNCVKAYNYVNEHLIITNGGRGITESLEMHLNKYGDIDINQKAKTNSNKVDSIVYSTLSSNKYNNQKSIVDAWDNAGFAVTTTESNFILNFKNRRLLHNNRIGIAKKNELILEKFNLYDSKSFHSINSNGNLTIDFTGYSEFQNLKRDHPDLYKYFKVLGYDKLKNLKFSSSQIKKAYLLETNNKLEVSNDIKEYIYSTFYCNRKYPSSFIKAELSRIYKIFDIKKPTPASIIKKYFNAVETTFRFKGVITKGYILYNKI